MKKILGSFYVLAVSSLVFFACAYVMVCAASFRFGYYATRFLESLAIKIGYGSLRAFPLIVAVIVLGAAAFVVHTYSLWMRAEYEKPRFLRAFYGMDIRITGVITVALVMCAVFWVFSTSNLLARALLGPITAYCSVMAFISAIIYKIRHGKLFNASFLRHFYRQFPINKPVGLLMTLAFFISLFILFNALFNMASALTPVLSLLLAPCLLLLIYCLSLSAAHWAEENEKALAAKIKSERFKTELITNVSHDIKTPLTTIINYAGLIGSLGIQNTELAEYSRVLEKKSLRLKTLIEDLIEASKAGTGNITVTPTKINLVELVGQIAGEFDEPLAASNLSLVSHLPREDVYITADSRHLWRVMENIWGNAVKYAMPGTRIYAGLIKSHDVVVFSLKNISREQLNIAPDELSEQFVRGDRARFSEGSGLGLYIAKSLTEAMGGEFDINISGDLFEVIITLNCLSQPQ